MASEFNTQYVVDQLLMVCSHILKKGAHRLNLLSPNSASFYYLLMPPLFSIALEWVRLNKNKKSVFSINIHHGGRSWTAKLSFREKAKGGRLLHSKQPDRDVMKFTLNINEKCFDQICPKGCAQFPNLILRENQQVRPTVIKFGPEKKILRWTLDQEKANADQIKIFLMLSNIETSLFKK